VLLLQYTCSDTLRDGKTTTYEIYLISYKYFKVLFLLIYNRTIPVTVAGANDPQYRLTESLTSYLNCRVRSRNKNLFTANQVRK